MVMSSIEFTLETYLCRKSDINMSSPRFVFFIAAITTLLFVTASAQQSGESLQFTYTGATGPSRWGIMNPGFSQCANGNSQSPINILKREVVVNKNLKPLVRSYDFTNVTLVNNKFNVGMRYPDHSGRLIVDDKVYTLKQMHWHAPSEHRIDGQRFAAELHQVHIADDGSVSVVAILFELGSPDPLVAKIQNHLNELAYEVKTHKDAPIEFGHFQATELRKKSKKYYRYVGSFTTPPCTENVVWHILGRVRSISPEQVEALKAPLDMRCKSNARPCQLINGRHVELYEEELTSHGSKN